MTGCDLTPVSRQVCAHGAEQRDQFFRLRAASTGPRHRLYGLTETLGEVGCLVQFRHRGCGQITRAVRYRSRPAALSEREEPGKEVMSASLNRQHHGRGAAFERFATWPVPT